MHNCICCLWFMWMLHVFVPMHMVAVVMCMLSRCLYVCCMWFMCMISRCLCAYCLWFMCTLSGYLRVSVRGSCVSVWVPGYAVCGLCVCFLGVFVHAVCGPWVTEYAVWCLWVPVCWDFVQYMLSAASVCRLSALYSICYLLRLYAGCLWVCCLWCLCVWCAGLAETV